MQRVLGAVGLSIFPVSAHAFGMGTTIAGFGHDAGFGTGGFRPTFDLVFDPVIVQIHVLDTLDAAFDDRLYLGANIYVDVYSTPIAGPWSGVIQPGGGFDLLSEPDLVGIAGECRFGIQTAERAGFGVYVVPALGFVSGEGSSDLYAGGALQISTWFSL